MPEARDRLLSRSNDDVSEMYSRRQTAVGSTGILPDNDDFERSVNRTPFRWGATPLTGDGSGQRIDETPTRTAIRGNTSGRGLFGSPVTGYRRGGRTPPYGSGFRRGRGGVLPSWYPRTPLRDITPLVRVERRSHLTDGEGSILGSPIPTNRNIKADREKKIRTLMSMRQEAAVVIYLVLIGICFVITTLFCILGVVA